LCQDNIDDIIALRIVLDIDQLDGESDDDYASRGAKLCNHALALARKLPKWSGNLDASGCVAWVVEAQQETLRILANSGGEGLKNYIAFPKPNGSQTESNTKST